MASGHSSPPSRLRARQAAASSADALTTKTSAGAHMEMALAMRTRASGVVIRLIFARCAASRDFSNTFAASRGARDAADVGQDDGVRDARHRRALPAAGCDDLDAAGHVGQCHHQQPVPGPRIVVQRGVLVWLEHHPQFRCAGEEFVMVGGQQRARGVGGVTDGPIAAQLDQDPLAVQRHTGVGGCVDASQLRASQLVQLVVPEVDGPSHHGSLEAWCAIHRHEGAHLGAFHLEHGLGVGQRCAAPPTLDHPRIARFGQRVGAEVGAHQHGVRVRPGYLRLGLCQLEPADHEFACLHVEFTPDGRVRAARGQDDQRSRQIGFEDVGAAPYPFLIVSSTEFIDIDQHIPLGGVSAVAVQRGASPQPARVGGIAPKVVEVFAAPGHIRNAGIGVEHLECLGAHLFEQRTAELRQRRIVVGAHPIQCLVVGDFFQPQVGVFLGRFRGPGRLGRHGRHCAGDGSVRCITSIDG